MITIAACFLSFVSTAWFAKRSLPRGLVAMLAWGYFYGIIRANYLGGASYFIFDLSIAGLLIGRGATVFSNMPRLQALRLWTLLLIGWPCILCLLPLQDPLISLVGLRGNIFFLPLMLFGAMLGTREIATLSLGLSILNCAALGFGVAEYLLGLQKFYPINAATLIIYASNDVAGYQFHRIPAIFVNAHSYGGAMVTSLPFLVGGWMQQGTDWKRRWLLLAGIAAALFGVLMSAARVHFAIAALLALVIGLSGRVGPQRRLLILALLLGVGYVATQNERLGRFKSLTDTDYIGDRIHGSVNRGFFDILENYPLGNGLGGGGTSIPYFLSGRVRNPIAMESEYARILAELGMVGFLLWVAFIGWFIVGSAAFARTPLSLSRRVAWVSCICYFVTGMIGLGMLTAIPQTASMLLAVGWVAARPLEDQSPQAAPMRPMDRRPAMSPLRTQ